MMVNFPAAPPRQPSIWLPEVEPEALDEGELLVELCPLIEPELLPDCASGVLLELDGLLVVGLLLDGDVVLWLDWLLVVELLLEGL